MILLEATGVKKRFGGVVALSNGNLVCRSGRITGLLGANGSGKSTISKIITGVYRADAGEIKFCGKPVLYKNPHAAKQGGISMVFQNLSLIPDLTVWQNIALGDERSKGLFLDNKEMITKSREITDRLLPGLDIMRKVSSLSSGEVQIVEIAKALYSKPKLLILDEPTAALETAQVKSLFAYMRELAAEGVGMIFTSHRMGEVMEICDDVVVFRNGEDVGRADFTTEEKDVDKLIGYIAGESFVQREHKVRTCAQGEPILSIKHLNYERKLKDVSLEVKPCEILGIGGLAGQGQVELLLAIAGSYKEATCEAVLMGKQITLNKPVHAVRDGILLVPEDRQLEGLFTQHSVYKNMIFPKLALKKQPLFTREKEYRAETAGIVETLSIKTHDLDTVASHLSGGNQQKIVVGKWLPLQAKVLLLIDPVKGVDIGAKTELYAYIEQQVEAGMSVILYASDSEELVTYSDRILVMYEGEVVKELTGDEISEDALIAASMHVSEVGV